MRGVSTIYLDMQRKRVLVNGMWWSLGDAGAVVRSEPLTPLRSKRFESPWLKMWLEMAGATIEIERLVVVRRWSAHVG